jgi:hypothetical protein
MATESTTDRRAFFASALASLTILTTVTTETSQAQEVANYWADVPPGATLWGVVVFTADEPVELTLVAGKSVRSLRGRFDRQRLTEYSWRNTSNRPERVGIRAKALAGDRELPASIVQFLGEQNAYVGFGQRGTPDKLADRKGGYPYEAVFVGFIIFGDTRSSAD